MDRALLLRHLAEADRHVAEGEHHLARQRRLVAELERDGHDTTSALDLLSTLEQTQAMHVSHRNQIRAELGAAA